MSVRSLLPALAVAAVLVAPQGAAAAPGVGALEAQPCPPRYLPGGLEFQYEPGDVAEARDHSRFKLTSQYVELIPPIDWGQPGTDSQTFRQLLASLNWTQILFDAYLAGDDGALIQARDILLDFARHQRYGRAGTVPWAWGTKRTGDRATYLSFLAREGTCEGILTASAQRSLLRAVVEHGRFMLDNPGKTNHGLFDGFALGVIAEQLPFMPQARKWRKEAKSRFKQVFFDRFHPEGFWLENSTRYHIGVTSLLERYLSLDFRHPNALEAALPAMQEVCAWLIEPDEREVQLGDTWLGDAPEDCVAASAAQDGASTLTGSGAAFVRVGGSYLAQFSQFFNSTHKHSDDLSFELFDGGHRVITDTGDYHRDKDSWRNFTQSAAAHSSLTVDGRDFSRDADDAYGSGIRAAGQLGGASGTWYAIQSRNRLLKKVDHRRTLLYKPGAALIAVDRVRAARAHDYERFFQFGPDFDADTGGPPPPAPLPLNASGYETQLWDSSSVPAERSVVQGRLEPLQGWTVPTFRNAIPRPTAILGTSGRDVDHAATISLDGSALRAELDGPVEPNGFTISLTDSLGPAGSLEVSRSGDQLEIVENP